MLASRNADVGVGVFACAAPAADGDQGQAHDQGGAITASVHDA